MTGTSRTRHGRNLSRSMVVALASMGPMLTACSSEPGPGFLAGGDQIELCLGEVDVPDPVLREALLARVPQPEPPDGEDPPEEPEPVIMAELLRSMRGLNLPGAGIQDLSGLECAQGLLSLGLADNEITNIEPLLHLTGLEQLELSGNQITDLSALGTLHRLTRLAVDENGVTNASPLANLTQLETLDLSGNELTDVSALRDLDQLAVLVLSRNQLTDVEALAGLERLIGLELDDNAIRSLEPLEGLVNLRFVDLDGNMITSLEPLSDAVDMQEIEASRNALTSLAGVEQMVGITRIVAQENQITSTAGVRNLVALSTLDLGDNALTSLEDVDGAVELQRLQVALNQVTDLSPIAGLPELRDLDLRFNEGLTDLSVVGTLPLLGFFGAGGYGQRQDMSALAGRQVLRSLNFTEAEVVDLAFFAELPGIEAVNFNGTPLSAEDLGNIALAPTLQTLRIDSAGLTDLSPLAALPLIEVITARDNMLERIDAFASWPSLNTAIVSGNPLTSLEGVEMHEILTELDVRDTTVSDLAPLVANETFRRGDTVIATGTALDADDCADIATIVGREGVVESDVECP